MGMISNYYSFECLQYLCMYNMDKTLKYHVNRVSIFAYAPWIEFCVVLLEFEMLLYYFTFLS